jgi:Pyridoxal-phosphate dependent enzyme
MNMSTTPASYLDPRTGRAYPLTDRRWRSDDDHPLMVTALSGIARGDIEVRDRSIWRYRAAFPVAIARPVSMGEGGTPLVQQDWDGLRPFFKLEWFNPTCSFKDRGAALLMSFLRQLGVEAVLEDSSGNGGAAIAAFGAAAGLRVKVLAPGPRENAQTEAIRQSASVFYASHNWHPCECLLRRRVDPAPDGLSCRKDGHARGCTGRYSSTCTPSSTTRSGGKRKKPVARTALRAMSTNRCSRQSAIPGDFVGMSVSRPRK